MGMAVFPAINETVCLRVQFHYTINLRKIQKYMKIEKYLKSKCRIDKRTQCDKKRKVR